jgi:hypothetical protein
MAILLDQSNLSTQRYRLIFWVECSVGGYLVLAKTILNVQIRKNIKKTRFIKQVHSSFTGTPACGSRAANLTRVLILSFIKLMF